MNGSLNYYVVSQLEMFGKRVGKRDEILYVESIYTMASGEKGVRGLTTLWCGGHEKTQQVI